MSIETLTLSNIMTKDVTTAEEKETLNAICKIMSDNKIGSVIIVRENSNEAIGIITERDILRKIAHDPSSVTMPARELMSKPLIIKVN